MNRYEVTLQGLTPLLMHKDNLAYAEKVHAWAMAPENKASSVAGDDRTPPWTWIGYLYHDGETVGIDADNVMTMLREGGAKVLTGKGKETFKKQTQSGIMIDNQQFAIFVADGNTVGMKDIKPLIGNMDFKEHIDTAELLGFELLVKRAKIGRAKHIRVRPMFRNWVAVGTVTVLDEELTGITRDVLQTILNQAGALCGLCDWRPSSPSSGALGKFSPTIKAVK